MSRRVVLTIEDVPDVRAGLRTMLEAEGYEVREAEDGPSGLECALEGKPDVVLLDLMIPGLDGFEVCRRLRAEGKTMPVLILTARSEEVDKVLGLELGADDYVVKPFSVRELLARVRALLRRPDLAREPDALASFGNVTVDLKRRRAEKAGKTIELYHYELEILRVLLSRSGETVPRQEILEEVWGFEAFPTSRTVDYHVCNLRRKLEADPAKPAHILTVHGVGYRLVT